MVSGFWHRAAQGNKDVTPNRNLGSHFIVIKKAELFENQYSFNKCGSS